MKTFQEYLQEAELMESSPAVGDVFELEIAREEIVLESYVVDVVEDGIVIEADDTMMRILMHVGYLTEDSRMQATANDSISPIHGGQDARKFNKQISADDDLEAALVAIGNRALDATVPVTAYDFTALVVDSTVGIKIA
jgi:hypothetical protein